VFSFVTTVVVACGCDLLVSESLSCLSSESFLFEERVVVVVVVVSRSAASTRTSFVFEDENEFDDFFCFVPCFSGLMIFSQY
jgi:hypothetical protein